MQRLRPWDSGWFSNCGKVRLWKDNSNKGKWSISLPEGAKIDLPHGNFIPNGFQTRQDAIDYIQAIFPPGYIDFSCLKRNTKIYYDPRVGLTVFKEGKSTGWMLAHPFMGLAQDKDGRLFFDTRKQAVEWLVNKDPRFCK